MSRWCWLNELIAYSVMYSVQTFYLFILFILWIKLLSWDVSIYALSCCQFESLFSIADYLNCKVLYLRLWTSRNIHNRSGRHSLYSFVCLCLVGFGVEGATLSRESIHSNKSQSITTTATAHTGQRTHTAFLLSTQVKTHSLTPAHMHTQARTCTHMHSSSPSQ